MMDLFWRSTWHFLVHFGIGTGIVLLLGIGLAWVSRRFVRFGNGLPAWAISTSSICLGVTIFASSVLTGLQTGAVGVLSQLIETESRSLVENGLLLAGKPLGINSSEQTFGLDELNQLAERYAPDVTQQSKAYLDSLEWLDQAEAKWQDLPAFIREQAAAATPRTEWRIKDVVDLAYQTMVLPATTAARWQAFLFAYSLAGILIGVMLCIDLFLRWLSRRLDSGPSALGSPS